MTELVEFLVKRLAEKKDEVVVKQEDNVITVSVARSDMGKIIGKQGKIIKAIRTIVKAHPDGKKATVEIIEAED